MVGVYFSGTGNTAWCAERFLQSCAPEGAAVAMEDPAAVELLRLHDEVLLAYPVYYSNLPKIVRDFIQGSAPLWEGKSVFVIATMGLFSGDGAGLAARLLRRHGAQVAGGLHVKMPDCICDVRALKRSPEKNREIVAAAGEKLDRAARRLRDGRPPREGLGPLYHAAGLFGQRLWFYGKTRSYTDKLAIDRAACVGCGRCAALCPMGNISIEGGKARARGRCTMCYRCVSRCPQRAITLIGGEVIEQHTVSDFL